MRAGEVVHVRYLLRHLDVHTVDQALAIVTQYFDESQLLPKTRRVLEAVLPE